MQTRGRHRNPHILRLVSIALLVFTLGMSSAGCDGLNPFGDDDSEIPQSEPNTLNQPGNEPEPEQIPDDAFDLDAIDDMDEPVDIPFQIVEAGIQEPRTLNPILLGDPLSEEISSLIFNGLTRVDPSTGDSVPDLAESWDVADDGTTIRFQLREDVTWHDDQPFTARDVQFTYDLMMNDRTRSPRFSRLVERVAAVEATGTYQVEFRLVAPYEPFLRTLATFGIVPQHLLSDVLPEELVTDPFGISYAIGTGPFRFTSWDRGNQLVLTAFGEYHGGSPAFDRYTYEVVIDQDELVDGLTAGRYDLARVAPEYLADIPEDADMRVASIPSFEMISVTLNLDHPDMLFDDQRVREALLLAIDRELIVEEIWHGHAQIANGTLPPASPAFRESEHRYGFDPDRAAALLDEAGWVSDTSGIRARDGVSLSIELVANGDNPQRRALAEQIVDSWREIGIDATVQFETWGTVLQHIRTSRDFPSLLFGYRWDIDPDQHAMWSSDSIPDAFNLSGYINRNVDQLLDEALTMSDPDERFATYGLVQDIVMADLPVLPMIFPNQTFVIGPRLHDAELTAILVRNRATISEWVPVETEQQEEPHS